MQFYTLFKDINIILIQLLKNTKYYIENHNLIFQLY